MQKGEVEVGEEDPLPVALGKLIDWRKEQGCLENQIRQVAMAEGQDEEGDVGGHGCEGEIMHALGVAAVAAEAEGLGGHVCERGEVLGEELDQCLSL